MRWPSEVAPVGRAPPRGSLMSGSAWCRTRGYNAFSYADVAAELDVTKAALHYHFSNKAELGEALLRRYVARFADALATIDVEIADAPQKIASYAEVYADVLQRERMCLCGMLAAEFETLPEPMRALVVGFFDDERDLAREGAGTRAPGRIAHVPGVGEASRAFRDRGSGGRHARRPSVRRCHAIPQSRGQPDCWPENPCVRQRSRPDWPRCREPGRRTAVR